MRYPIHKLGASSEVVLPALMPCRCARLLTQNQPAGLNLPGSFLGETSQGDAPTTRSAVLGIVCTGSSDSSAGGMPAVPPGRTGDRPWGSRNHGSAAPQPDGTRQQRRIQLTLMHLGVQTSNRVVCDLCVLQHAVSTWRPCKFVLIFMFTRTG